MRPQPDLLARLPKGFQVLDSPESPHEDPFQLAVYYRQHLGFIPQLPLIAADELDVPRGTRPMLALNLALPGHVIRFVACHWTGMDEGSSRVTRARLAEFLRSEIYDFLHPATPANDAARHIVVLGDLNEEPPHELFAEYLSGYRDRMSSRKGHWRDLDVRRIRLYDLAWRFLGEQHPHGPGRPTMGGPVGTFYSKDKGWRTYDHVLVSGGLLGEEPPTIDEGNTRVVSLPILCDERGLPSPFVPGNRTGLSDHLPIVGQIFLRGN